MDSQTLASAMGNSLSMQEYENFVGPFTEAMAAADCTNINRAAMWCGQLGHESLGLRYMEEIADGSAYEGRLDLGNTQPGDGRRYKGRGPIQLTGRGNYRRFGQWAHSRSLVPTDDFFENDPIRVAEPKWGFLAASYYWTAARPQLNSLSDDRDIENATRAINGGTTGLDDRTERWQRCLNLGAALLAGNGGQQSVVKVLPYPRGAVTQDTGFNCAPASSQTVIVARINNLIAESTLGSEMGTDVEGTDSITLVAPVLNRYLPGADYRATQMPHDPASHDDAQRLWDDVTCSIDNGYGVVANIVAPPSNYPRGVRDSVSPEYGGGTVFHYIALMGYADDNQGRAFWVADSGFRPYGYWCSYDQMATLIPPKGYAAARGGVPVDSNAFPLPAGYYYGPFEGPQESISGRAGEPQAWIDGLRRWQQKAGVPVDGVYGTATRQRAIEYQRAAGQLTLGTIGPMTWDLAFEEPHDVVIGALDTWTQLLGADGKGWPQLGGRTLVNGVAAVGEKMAVAGFAAPAGQVNAPDRDSIDDRVLDSWTQLLGVDGKGWPQLNGRTIVDAVSSMGEELGIAAFQAPAAHTNVPSRTNTNDRVLDLWIQLLGFDGKGWPQIAGRTFVDAVAAVGHKMDLPGFLPPGGHTNVPQRTDTDGRMSDIRIQLLGVDGTGWPQLDGRTLVDAVATIGLKLGIDGFAA